MSKQESKKVKSSDKLKRKDSTLLDGNLVAIYKKDKGVRKFKKIGSA